MIQLENDDLEVVIQEKGAEIIHLKEKKSQTEYIWSGDEAYWGRHAPILFPIVGKVIDNTYRIKDNIYHLSQHGFARDMDFQVLDQTKTSISLTLSWNQETLKNYPYKFELIVCYTLRERILEVEYQVKNLEENMIYFSIGAHPGFRCPLNEGESFEDYSFIFENKETIDRIPISKDGLFETKKKPYLDNEDKIPLSHELFHEDALVFEDLKSDKISLIHEKTGQGIEVYFPKFPFLGLWSKPTGAPFVCIEPWFGHADYTNFQGDFRDKEDIISLKAKEVFHCSFQIRILS